MISLPGVYVTFQAQYTTLYILRITFGRAIQFQISFKKYGTTKLAIQVHKSMDKLSTGFSVICGNTILD